MNVTNNQLGTLVALGPYPQVRHGILNISGLSEGPNTIPHGLPYVPGSVRLRPFGGSVARPMAWMETQAPDDTNIYVTVASGAATGGNIEYREN